MKEEIKLQNDTVENYYSRYKGFVIDEPQTKDGIEEEIMPQDIALAKPNPSKRITDDRQP